MEKHSGVLVTYQFLFFFFCGVGIVGYKSLQGMISPPRIISPSVVLVKTHNSESEKDIKYSFSWT